MVYFTSSNSSEISPFSEAFRDMKEHTQTMAVFWLLIRWAKYKFLQIRKLWNKTKINHIDLRINRCHYCPVLRTCFVSLQLTFNMFCKNGEKNDLLFPYRHSLFLCIVKCLIHQLRSLHVPLNSFVIAYHHYICFLLRNNQQWLLLTNGQLNL